MTKYIFALLILFLALALFSCGPEASGGGSSGAAPGITAPDAPALSNINQYTFEIIGTGESFGAIVYTNFGEVDQVENDWGPVVIPAPYAEMVVFGRQVLYSISNRGTSPITINVYKSVDPYTVRALYMSYTLNPTFSVNDNEGL